MNELTDIIKDIVKRKEEGAADDSISSDTYACKYCERGFRKEKTLEVHMCEPKRRWEQKNEVSTVLGMTAFLRYYEIQHGTSKLKDYGDFVDSKFYNAFVKFGKHIVDINAIEPNSLIDFVVLNQIKIQEWCHESTYIRFLEDYIGKEDPNKALERSVKTIIKWCDEHERGLEDFFSNVSGVRLVNYIRDGRISPWILYNCEQGQDALGHLNDEQLGILFNIIDPRLWNLKNKNYPGDSEYIKYVLHEAGID